MVAPEKVQLGLRINDYDDWEIQGYSFLEDKQVGMTEYVRTDAFIEKAAEWLNNFYNEDTHSYLIDKDIEKFINYMKGE